MVANNYCSALATLQSNSIAQAFLAAEDLEELMSGRMTEARAAELLKYAAARLLRPAYEAGLMDEEETP